MDFFRATEPEISSAKHKLASNQVLARIRTGLTEKGFDVERGKKKAQKIHVPVLFGRQGRPEKSFEANAYPESARMVLEVEAGRGVVNNQFLKDLFQACMMHGVDYFGVAVRNDYRGTNDFEGVLAFFDTLYASNRLQLPLFGLLVVG